MSAIAIRPATRNDAAHLAILDNVASHGLSLWFWQGAVNMNKADDPHEWGKERLSDDDAPFGWKNSRIAELNGDIAGAANFYLSPEVEPEPGDPKQNAAPFVPVAELFALTAGEWYLDSLAVYRSARNSGVGRALMDDFFERGAKSVATRASLIAEDSNKAALALYRGCGFEERERRAFVPFGTKTNTKNWLLLSAPLN